MEANVIRSICIYLNKIILVLHMYDVLQFFVL